ncbi:uncharacterized protein BDZ99DRAFT_469790 [Mytilinidion resinicola]|uniref:Uncharacterized protein n=1 Tax=Mytilinidion resinicola TaxID=574789 RepID=A0A6A6XXK0_9PEZI|nr:uncharacterized protein BDZ99DRAFT_469790 [Mytilinidion resinicola]KAF2801276.1 hypothetical protein BDZ99DRAFT_469790 [Mytilinidion resinicola]
MSLRETTTLAHTAQCKLHMAINRPDRKDRDWRFVLGHAVVLDNLMLRLVEIEEGIEKGDHSSDVKFKGAGGVKSTHHKPSPLAAEKRARRSPPPQRIDESSSEDEAVDEDDEEDGLGLMRFPSGSSRPPQPPALDPSDDDSSSSDEDLDDLMQPVFNDPDPEVLKKVTGEKGNQEMAQMYNDVKGCPCHGKKEGAPVVKNFWELPLEGNGEIGGKRMGVVEVAA